MNETAKTQFRRLLRERGVELDREFNAHLADRKAHVDQNNHLVDQCATCDWWRGRRREIDHLLNAPALQPVPQPKKKKVTGGSASPQLDRALKSLLK